MATFRCFNDGSLTGLYALALCPSTNLPVATSCVKEVALVDHRATATLLDDQTTAYMLCSEVVGVQPTTQALYPCALPLYPEAIPADEEGSEFTLNPRGWESIEEPLYPEWSEGTVVPEWAVEQCGRIVEGSTAPVDYTTWTRKQIQAEAKKRGHRANQTTVHLIKMFQADDQR